VPDVLDLTRTISNLLLPLPSNTLGCGMTYGAARDGALIMDEA
jgi:hypothetical protein